MRAHFNLPTCMHQKRLHKGTKSYLEFSTDKLDSQAFTKREHHLTDSGKLLHKSISRNSYLVLGGSTCTHAWLLMLTPLNWSIPQKVYFTDHTLLPNPLAEHKFKAAHHQQRKARLHTTFPSNYVLQINYFKNIAITNSVKSWALQVRIQTLFYDRLTGQLYTVAFSQLQGISLTYLIMLWWKMSNTRIRKHLRWPVVPHRECE